MSQEAKLSTPIENKASEDVLHPVLCSTSAASQAQGTNRGATKRISATTLVGPYFHVHQVYVCPT